MQLTINKDSFNSLVKFSSSNNVHYKKLAAHLVQLGLFALENNKKLYVQAENGFEELTINLESLKVTNETVSQE